MENQNTVKTDNSLIGMFKAIPWWGWVLGVALFIFQRALYSIGVSLSEMIGTADHAVLLKIPMIDDAYPFVPVFVIIYLYAFIYWLCAPAVVSLTPKRNIVNYLIGFVIALGVMFVALEWTQREVEDNSELYTVKDVSLNEEMIPITLPEKKTVPPPPAAVTKAEIIEIVEDDADIEEDIMASTEDNTEWVDIDDYDVVTVEPEPEEEEIFMVVEDQPEFPGGTAALLDYLRKNIKYPAICRENNIQGRVLVTFIVNKDGAIVEPEVVKSVHPQLDREALRVISTMPNWKPGSQRGKPVRVKYTVPVNFRLN